MRVLKWMVERIHGGAREVQETPVGFLPTPAALDTSGLRMPSAQLTEALRVDAGEWLHALSDLGEFYGQFGSRLPQPIVRQLAQTRRGFGG
jgi:phosphoenolpyruvate carboxykinase (GTP)